MRLALFEIAGVSCSVALDKVLHILTDPHLFQLPLLRPCFDGSLVYQGQVVPLLVGKRPTGVDDSTIEPAFVLVCEAEFGPVGVPADRIVRITNAGEVDSETISGCDSQSKSCKINDRDYRLLDLNKILEDPDFTVCGLKD